MSTRPWINCTGSIWFNHRLNTCWQNWSQRHWTLYVRLAVNDWWLIHCVHEIRAYTPGFPRLMENHGIYIGKFPGPGKSWKMTLVLKSPGNLLAGSWKVLEFARQWYRLQFLASNGHVSAVENCCRQVCFLATGMPKMLSRAGLYPDPTGGTYSPPHTLCYLNIAGLWQGAGKMFLGTGKVAESVHSGACYHLFANLGPDFQKILRLS